MRAGRLSLCSQPGHRLSRIEIDTMTRAWLANLWILCAAWPGILFFVLLSFIKPVVPSWPLPSLVPLVVIVAVLISRNLATDLRLKQWWTGLVAYGLGAALLIMFPTVLARLPWVGSKLDKSVVSRLRGSRNDARSLLAVAHEVATPDARPPIIVTLHYMKASLDTFYTPDRGNITITTACGYVGSRPNNFDNWDDTRLGNPAFVGRNLLLVGGEISHWRDVLIVDRVEPVPKRPDLFLATNFQGKHDRPSRGVAP